MSLLVSFHLVLIFKPFSVVRRHKSKCFEESIEHIVPPSSSCMRMNLGARHNTISLAAKDVIFDLVTSTYVQFYDRLYSVCTKCDLGVNITVLYNFSVKWSQMFHKYWTRWTSNFHIVDAGKNVSNSRFQIHFYSRLNSNQYNSISSHWRLLGAVFNSGSFNSLAVEVHCSQGMGKPFQGSDGTNSRELFGGSRSCFEQNTYIKYCPSGEVIADQQVIVLAYTKHNLVGTVAKQCHASYSQRLPSLRVVLSGNKG